MKDSPTIRELTSDPEYRSNWLESMADIIFREFKDSIDTFESETETSIENDDLSALAYDAAEKFLNIIAPND